MDKMTVFEHEKVVVVIGQGWKCLDDCIKEGWRVATSKRMENVRHYVLYFPSHLTDHPSE